MPMAHPRRGGPISGPDEGKEVLSLRFRLSQSVFGQFPGSYHGDHSEKGGNHRERHALEWAPDMVFPVWRGGLPAGLPG